MPTTNILCHLLVDSCYILFENHIHCWWQSKVRLFQHTSHCFSHNLIIAEFEDETSIEWSYKNAIYQDCKKCEIVMLSPESYDCCPRTSWGKFNGSICFSCVTSSPAFTNYSLPKNYGKVKISRIYQDVVFARRESLLNCVINSSGLGRTRTRLWDTCGVNLPFCYNEGMLPYWQIGCLTSLPLRLMADTEILRGFLGLRPS